MTQPAAPAPTAGTGTPGDPADDSTGAITVSLAVPDDVAAALPQGTEEPEPSENGEPEPDADDAPALRLISLPKPDTLDPASFLITVLTAVRDAASANAAITGQVSGIGRAADPDGTGDEWFALVDAPAIDGLRTALLTALATSAAPDGTPLATPDHGYVPKIVLGDLAPDATLPEQRLDAIPVTFGTVVVIQDDTIITVPLGPPAANPTRTDPSGQPVASGDVAVQPGQLVPDTTAADGIKARGGKGGPPIARGSWVTAGNVSGRVDLVVTTGKVPGVDGDVEGSAADPALRVVVYEQTDGKWAATSNRIGTRVSKVKRTLPLTMRNSSKGSGYAALVGMQAEHEVRVEADGLPAYAMPTGSAIKAVYERGVSSWPGEQVTALDAQRWGTERVKAFLATAVGQRPEGYHRDDDLLPAAHPEYKGHGGVTPGPGEVVLAADEVKGMIAAVRGE